jgi:iron complex outermembrane recepter protein
MSQVSRGRLLASSILVAASMVAGAAFAQPVQQAAAESAPRTQDVVIVTGTRIQTPGVVSSSPITTVGAAEIALQQVAEAEKLLRNLPITVPGDGGNTNNGTAGVSTVNLRGLGAQRNLIMIDGKRLTPYNIDGQVDVSVIPVAMLDRVDILTGGASAVYGSDAISGAINFVLKRDFEGVELDVEHSRTGENDGALTNASLALGANLGDGRGNVALVMNYSKREGVQFGDRPYGFVGVSTATGAGLASLGGTAPQPANCGGTNTVPTTFGGSGTTLPARIIMPAFDPDGAGPLASVSGARQFREDGTLGPNCNQFNFNPYNYYQTPQERYSGMAYGYYRVTDNIEAYGRLNFSAINVRQQIAPSGIFNTPLVVPLNNPFIGAAARTEIINQFNGARQAGALTLTGATQNWYDLNNNGVVDAADSVRFAVGRRTVEFGERSTTFDNNMFQVLLGLRGEIGEDFNWDVSLSHGESDRTNISAGYTNVENVRAAVNTISATTCTPPAGGPTEGTRTASCVPINLFGREGSITPAMAGYSSATALEQQNYTQTIASASFSGALREVKTPWAEAPLAFSIGAEYREETGVTTPDECLKLAPASCLGGAGGDTLPVNGGFSTSELFGEVLLPLVTDKPLFQNLTVELGFRWSDFDPSGTTETWKAGFNWELSDDFRFRVMQQKAVRAPNVSEIASPRNANLDNATIDPCSVANAARIDARLRALCISTGMTNAQVGVAPDIVAGQVNIFVGTNPLALPKPEEADTTTVGFVYTPSWLTVVDNPVMSLDYYRIRVDGYIDSLSAQEVFTGCYERGNTALCSRVRRVDGNLIFPGSGIELLTENLVYYEVEGLELGINFGLGLDRFGLDEKWGALRFSYNGNLYLTNEYQPNTVLPVTDCNGFYGNSCGNPTHKYRHVQRTTWTVGDFQFSYLWRYQDSVKVQPNQAAGTFAQFRQVDAYNYIDLAASYAFNENLEFSFGVNNLFEEDPPILGGEIGTTATNGGNTFPQNYDPLGRVFTLGVNVKF